MDIEARRPSDASSLVIREYDNYSEWAQDIEDIRRWSDHQMIENFAQSHKWYDEVTNRWYFVYDWHPIR